MRRKIIGVVILSFALCLMVLPARGADSFPPIKKDQLASAQPRFSGYRLQDIRSWSPQTDPYAHFLRAEIPLQKRISSLAATQANPQLDGKAEIMLMQGDYGNSFFNSFTTNNDFAEHTLNFWQYADYFSPWHGAATSTTPIALYDPKTSDWRNRGFEFGILNIPNPAYTNAAHRNGVKSIASFYFDPNFRPGSTFAESFAKNPKTGNYIIAEKLVEMARYYGYDGYFLNQEEMGSAEKEKEFKPFMAYLNSHGLYTQLYENFPSKVYDGNASWLKDKQHGRIHDSIFVNYGWTRKESLDSSFRYIKDHKLDPYKEIFFGIESNQSKFSGSHASGGEISKIYATGTKNPRASIALFTPSDYYQRSLDDDIKAAIKDDAKFAQRTKELPLMQQNDYQWMIAQRERMFFSGVKSNPRETGNIKGFSRADVGVKDASKWAGAADFAPARSVIKGTSFYSTFNTGHGMEWYSKGKVSNAEPWTNINVQSLLPSWQWWIGTKGSRPVVDFDYGTKLPRKSVEGKNIPSPFKPQGAWRGGSSLVIHGNITAPTTLRLFKTDLDISANSKLKVVFKKASADKTAMKAALIFADNPKQTVAADITNVTSENGWNIGTVNLTSYAGKKLATIGMQFDQATNYQMNIGEVSLVTSSATPPAPTGIALQKIYDNGQAIISWKKANFSEVDGYQVTATYADGHTSYLTGGYTDTAYIKNIGNTSGTVIFKVRAIGKNGQLSAPATVKYDFSKQQRDIKVEQAKTTSKLLTQASTPGELHVSWKPTGDQVCHIGVNLVDIAPTSSDNQHYYTDAPCSAGKAVVKVPVKEGYAYDLTITSPGNKPGITYRGYTHDSIAATMPMTDFEFANKQVIIHTPSPTDWWKLKVEFQAKGSSAISGITAGVIKRGDANSRGLQDPKNLPASDGTMLVTITDYSGNVTVQKIAIANYKPVDNGKPPVFVVTPKTSQKVELGKPMTPIKVAIQADSPVKLDFSKALPKGIRWVPEMDIVKDKPIQAASLNAIKGVLEGTPVEAGKHIIKFIATDAFGRQSAQEITIDVADTSGPHINVADNITLELGVEMKLIHLSAEDKVDGTVPVQIVGTLPDGLSYNNANISGTPKKLGVYPVTLTARDRVGNHVEKQWIITVKDTIAPKLKIVPAQITTKVGSSVTGIAITATDAGKVTISASGLPDGVKLVTSAASSTVKATLEGQAVKAGQYVITITAIDEAGNKTAGTLNLKVTDTSGNVPRNSTSSLNPVKLPKTGY